MNPNNHILEVGLCVSAFICLSAINITQKQIIAKAQNLIFRICAKCKCYMKLSMEIGQIFCIQEILRDKNFVRNNNSDTFLPMD